MKWSFQQGGKNESPQNAAIKEFSKHIFESIVREAIQNSLDNKDLTKNETVRVTFEFLEVPKAQIPGYDDLMVHYDATKKFWSDDGSYRTIFEAVDERIKDFTAYVPILRITDENTTGMNLHAKNGENKRLTNYFAFTRGNNTVKQNSNSGGSEGQGKAAFYGASSLRTIFVHTHSIHGSICEGLTKLATHTIAGTDYSSDGHLFQEINDPEYESNSGHANEFYRRTSKLGFGTTISIIGLWNYDQALNKMIKAVINNFWMAITEGDLVVQVANIIFNSDNIEKLIEEYLPERKESSRTKSDPTEYGRARCYYETWTKATEKTEAYEEQLPILGSCRLKIAEHEEYPGKVAFFRKQKMLIVRSQVNSKVSKGYCGVFICDDDEGNALLRKMEGKTHTEWDHNFCMTQADTEKAKIAIDELNAFVSTSWSKFIAKHFPESIDLNGLSGLALGKKKTNIKPKETNQAQTSKTTKKEHAKQKEFTKLGIRSGGLTSRKQNGNWTYNLQLNSNEDKRVIIRMTPATDSARVTHSELLNVSSANVGWIISTNSIEGELTYGLNSIEFELDESERVALDLNIQVL